MPMPSPRPTPGPRPTPRPAITPLTSASTGPATTPTSSPTSSSPAPGTPTAKGGPGLKDTFKQWLRWYAQLQRRRALLGLGGGGGRTERPSFVFGQGLSDISADLSR